MGGLAPGSGGEVVTPAAPPQLPPLPPPSGPADKAAEAAGAPLPPAAPPQLPPLPPLEDEVVTPEEEEAISSIMQSGTVRAVSVPYTRDVAYQALLSTI